MLRSLTRREALGTTLGLLAGGLSSAADAKSWKLATFSAEVAVPIGHALMGGGIAPAARVEDPLYALGLILLGAEKPIALVAVDWCEIRNDAYERWRSLLAETIGTTPERVLVCNLHQHDAPVVDLEAQRILEAKKLTAKVCDLEFHEKAVQAVAKAAKASLSTAQKVTHFGVGEGKVEQLASNRRYIKEDGKPGFSRTSATRDPKLREYPEGTIDPMLKTLSFWDGDTPLAAVSCYAIHPMSYYGRGGVSSDFVGLARKRRQADEPKVFQMYLSGCSGNVTAGKYNDGAAENRPILAEKLYQGMESAWQATKKQPLTKLDFRNEKYRLEPRAGEFTAEKLEAKLTVDSKPFAQCLAAMGLSWRKRVASGLLLDMPAPDLGSAQVVLLPGESYVEYQLLAQKLKPEQFIMVIGYGESATGYVPTDKAVQENDSNLGDWCWVAPGAEKVLTETLQKVLQAK